MGELIDLDEPGGARGYLALPPKGQGAAVIVIQEWWGLNPQTKGVADKFAEAGFVALAPDLYRGELAGHDEMDKAGHLMTSLPPDRAAADMSHAIDHLLAHPAVTSASVGVVGFCMGGMLTFMLAAIRGDAVSAAVPFYGYPGPGNEPDWTALTAKVRGHLCEVDDHFPAAGARELQSKLLEMGKDVAIEFHDAGHAFMNETDPFGVYDADLAAALWPQVIEFLAAEVA